MSKPGYLVPVAKRQLSMAWLERIACGNVNPDAFMLDGQNRLGPVHFELLARCDRCPVLDKCKEMHDNMQKSTGGNGYIAAGRVYGTTFAKPHSRPLTPHEKRRYEKWQEETTTRLLLW